jgi:hypothetical protein
LFGLLSVALLSVALTRGGYTRLGEIPDHGEHKVTLDRAIGVLRDKATAHIPIETVILVKQVVYGIAFSSSWLFFSSFFPIQALIRKDIIIGGEYRRFLPDIEIAVGMDLEIASGR